MDKDDARSHAEKRARMRFDTNLMFYEVFPRSYFAIADRAFAAIDNGETVDISKIPCIYSENP